jgi:hypothetical protein
MRADEAGERHVRYVRTRIGEDDRSAAWVVFVKVGHTVGSAMTFRERCASEASFILLPFPSLIRLLLDDIRHGAQFLAWQQVHPCLP